MGEENAGGRRRVALVTGASSGFGLLATVRLAERGWIVYAGLRDPARGSALLEAASRAGVSERVRPIALDVTREEQARAAADTIEAEAGAIDALVANAGFAAGGFVEEVPLAKWREQFETNLFGVVATTQAVLPRMRRQGGGRIVLVSSVSGKMGFPSMGPYVASKHALEGLGESLRLELAPYGIAVSLILPGPYRTAIWGKGLSGGATPGPDSPYASYYAKLLPQIERSGAQGGDPDVVARTIVRALTDARPKLRYLPTGGERLTLAAKRWLPWRWIEAAVLKAVAPRNRE
ncbi:SDR family oxidoreductase [Cohnella sp. REN36]|uniref:SDR family oxidoreductase n=1 Tax=Cohnella sp. REN36 TaxID=2887347 RepID=UPI001D13FF0C|nr:SDR family oxidoreductase [Cohnella sp. REN36]MCC3374816.1 SDR family oxidoreductase [Cohnella sp. REN36]